MCKRIAKIVIERFDSNLLMVALLLPFVLFEVLHSMHADAFTVNRPLEAVRETVKRRHIERHVGSLFERQ